MIIEIDDETCKKLQVALGSAEVNSNKRQCLFRSERECTADCALWLSGSDGITGKCSMADVAEKHYKKLASGANIETKVIKCD